MVGIVGGRVEQEGFMPHAILRNETTFKFGQLESPIVCIFLSKVEQAAQSEKGQKMQQGNGLKLRLHMLKFFRPLLCYRKQL